jgi:hypothetical protein
VSSNFSASSNTNDTARQSPQTKARIVTQRRKERQERKAKGTEGADFEQEGKQTQNGKGKILKVEG